MSLNCVCLIGTTLWETSSKSQTLFERCESIGNIWKFLTKILSAILASI